MKMDLIDEDGVISSTWIVQYFRRKQIEIDRQSDECTPGPDYQEPEDRARPR